MSVHVTRRDLLSTTIERFKSIAGAQNASPVSLFTLEYLSQRSGLRALRSTRRRPISERLNSVSISKICPVACDDLTLADIRRLRVLSRDRLVLACCRFCRSGSTFLGWRILLMRKGVFSFLFFRKDKVVRLSGPRRCGALNRTHMLFRVTNSHPRSQLILHIFLRARRIFLALCIAIGEGLLRAVVGDQRRVVRGYLERFFLLWVVVGW